MNKQEFLAALSAALKDLPRAEHNSTMNYYDELIADHIEDGVSEEEAVGSLGSVSDIARYILQETKKERPRKEYSSGNKALIITLLILGFPIWGALLITVVCLLLVAYILLFVPVIVLGVCAISFFAAALFAIAGTPFLIGDLGMASGLFQLGAAVLVLGLSLLSGVALISTTKAVVKAGNFLWSKFISCFRRRRVY